MLLPQLQLLCQVCATGSGCQEGGRGGRGCGGWEGGRGCGGWGGEGEGVVVLDCGSAFGMEIFIRSCAVKKRHFWIKGMFIHCGEGAGKVCVPYENCKSR